MQLVKILCPVDFGQFLLIYTFIYFYVANPCLPIMYERQTSAGIYFVLYGCSEKKDLRSKENQTLNIHTADKSFGTTSFLPFKSTLAKEISLGSPKSRFSY